MGSGTGAETSTGGSTTGLGTSSGTSTGNSKIPVGPCTSDGACLSGVCGINGSGHCCQKSCTSVTAPCGATDCDADTGACLYPDSKVSCGGTSQCDGNTLTGASFCDGVGDCRVESIACQTGTFCDAVGEACCSGLSEAGALSVDNGTGKDLACCGFGGNGPCQTLSRAMQLVDAAHARRTVITATVEGGGGDWANGETYPVALGWGVELTAPGVNFDDPGGSHEIFDITSYSINDTVGFVSIVGSVDSPVVVGMKQGGGQSPDNSSIQVESDQTLYLANATVTSSSEWGTTAITVIAGGALKLAQDESGFETGTVNIGYGPDGWAGIVCTTAGTQGCRITDAMLNGGTSVVMQGQQEVDLSVEDFGVVQLRSAPIIGVEPGDAGFLRCPSKDDTAASNGSAISVFGKASVELWDGAVQCIHGIGIALQGSELGTPTLQLIGTTVRNTQLGLWVRAGSASVDTSAFMYNAIGVQQDDVGTIDLDGLNTVACNSGREIGQSGGGVSVLNTSSDGGLDAQDVLWDTAGPDLFSCESQLQTCTCEATSCSEDGGAGEDMSAVYTSTGTIDTSRPQTPAMVCNEL